MVQQSLEKFIYIFIYFNYLSLTIFELLSVPLQKLQQLDY